MAALRPLLYMAMLALAGCATPDLARSGPESVEPVGKAARIAVALAEAERAAGADPAALERALVMLDGLGAAPAEGTLDLLPGWRDRLPAGSPAARPTRGRALGAAYRHGWVEAGGAVVIEQIFLAGQSARVAVASPDGGGLGLTVMGKDRRPICAATAGGSACQWLPLYTERFAMRVENGSGARRRYFLVVE